MSEHALLSASSSSRWLRCTPSARLEAGFADTSSEYAEEGTRAHAAAEHILTRLTCTDPTLWFPQDMPIFDNQEMEEAVGRYVDTCMERVNAARKRTPDAQVLIEQRLDYSPWVPEGFGTGDMVIIADDTMEIIDLKYGKGVPVSAIGNTQMRLYALGAWNTFNLLYDIKKVTMTIVQPRLDSITSDTLTIDELLLWGKEVQPLAQKAWKGEGAYCPGDHCHFCRAAIRCKALAEKNLEIAKYDFMEADLLTDEDIVDILDRTATLTKWLKTINDYALREAVDKGKRWPQYKLVEGRSTRVIAQPTALAEVLEKEKYTHDQIYMLRKLTELEKLVGKKKFATLAAEYISKPPGKPTLVPETDKRDEWIPNQTIIDQFDEED